MQLLVNICTCMGDVSIQGPFVRLCLGLLAQPCPSDLQVSEVCLGFTSITNPCVQERVLLDLWVQEDVIKVRAIVYSTVTC